MGKENTWSHVYILAGPGSRPLCQARRARLRTQAPGTRTLNFQQAARQGPGQGKAIPPHGSKGTELCYGGMEQEQGDLGPPTPTQPPLANPHQSRFLPPLLPKLFINRKCLEYDRRLIGLRTLPLSLPLQKK